MAGLDLFNTRKKALADTLAKCYYWQQFGGANYTETQARARVYLDAIEPADVGIDQFGIGKFSDLRPYALVWNDGDELFIADQLAVSDGNGYYYNKQGLLWMRIEANVADIKADTLSEAHEDFLKYVGDILYTNNGSEPGLLDLFGQDGNPSFLTVTAEGPYRTPPEDRNAIGDAFVVFLSFAWGTAPP